jgi:hypothetical protein
MAAVMELVATRCSLVKALRFMAANLTGNKGVSSHQMPNLKRLECTPLTLPGLGERLSFFGLVLTWAGRIR